VDEATLHLPNGKSFKIVAENLSDANAYVQSVELEWPSPLSRSFCVMKRVAQGASCRFVMSHNGQGDLVDGEAGEPLLDDGQK